MYIGYIFYYFTRQSLTFITPFLCTDLGFDKADVGILATVFAVFYGISKFTNGIFCDRSNPRYFMAFGLILTGIFNILFGFSSSLFIFGLLWALNGWFQGWGWPPCAKLLTHWFGREERGTWWSACTTSHNIGGFAIALLAAACGQRYGWRAAMCLPGVLCIGVGFFLLNRLRDIPESLGLPSIEKFKGEARSKVVEEVNDSEKPLSVKRMLLDQILTNKYVWVLSISYFFVYLIRTAVHTWGNLYLVETKGYTPFLAASCVAWFEVGGFFGMLFAGWGSDRWFHGRRVPFTVIASIGVILSLMAFWYLVPEHFILQSCMLGLIGFFIFGPQMLVGLAAAEFVNKNAASTANGFAGFWANLGAAVAGYPLMKLTLLLGWEAFIFVLVCSAVVITFTLLPMWSVKTPTEERVPERLETEPRLQAQES
jgi:OPA family sugar phosphate sensor protein UhpC-like MFS transporter